MKPNILLFMLMAAMAGCNNEPPPPARVERPALTMVANQAVANSDSAYSGEIRARHEVQMGFNISGKIIDRLVEVGTQVKAGQALMRLDTGDTGLQLAAVEAQHQLAEADAKRYRELRARGFVSQSALDAKEAALKVVTAQVGLARNQSAYTTLFADAAGVVTMISAEMGQVVAAGQPVLRLARHGEREVAIAIPESQLTDIRPGAIASVILSANDGSAAPLTGRLRELSPAADPVSRTYAARIALDKSAATIALGMTAQVRFAAGRQEKGILVPLSAIFQQGNQPAVWIVSADRSVKLRAVQIAAYRNDGALVVDGLNAGERIVSNGVHRLAVGEKIRVIENGDAQ